MSKEILNISDAPSSAHIDAFNSSEGKYDNSSCSNVLSQKDCVNLLVNFVGHEDDDILGDPTVEKSVFDVKEDSIVSEDQIGHRTVKLFSETEVKYDSTTKTKSVRQICEEKIYLV